MWSKTVDTTLALIYVRAVSWVGGTTVEALMATCRRVVLAVSLIYLGAAGRLASAETLQPFAEFNVRTDIDIEDGEIEVIATFALGAASNGIDPAKENTTLQVTGGSGTYSVTMPSGSFKPASSGESKFQGTIGGVKLLAWIRRLRSGTFEFEVITEGAKLYGMANPITVRLTVGDDVGSRTVRAKIE
jgi:hypothetical protein